MRVELYVKGKLSLTVDGKEDYLGKGSLKKIKKIRENIYFFF